MSLSRSDVALLTRDSSPQMRAAVADKLARQLESPELTAAEVEVAQEIVRILARDIEATVRRTLAEGLRHSARLPNEVARRLANDIEEVALPILTDSDVLTSEDLIAIIGAASSTKEAAIARRPNLAEDVSDALVTGGQASAVAVLMRNATAHITESSLNTALRRFPDDDAVKEGMAHREALPIAVVERLVAVASDRLKTYLLSHQAMSAAAASDIVLQTREQATLDLSYGRGELELLQLVRQMHVGGRLAPSLVLRAICLGDIDFFEASVAVMTDVPLNNVRLLIQDDGPGGLESLLKASGLPAPLFGAIRVAVNVVRQSAQERKEHTRSQYRSIVVARILSQFETFALDDLDYLIDRLGDGYWRTS